MTQKDYRKWLWAFFKEKDGFTVYLDDDYVSIDSSDLYIDMTDGCPYVSVSATITNILHLEAVFDMWKKVR